MASSHEFEFKSITSEHSQSWQRKAAIAFALGTISVGCLIGLNKMGDIEANNPDLGEKDPRIVALNLDEGANIRHDPIVGDKYNSNIVRQLPKKAHIILKDGPSITQNENGTWYCFNSHNLDTSIKDKDNIVCVNEQKAHPEYQ